MWGTLNYYELGVFLPLRWYVRALSIFGMEPPPFTFIQCLVYMEWVIFYLSHHMAWICHPSCHHELSHMEGLFHISCQPWDITLIPSRTWTLSHTWSDTTLSTNTVISLWWGRPTFQSTHISSNVLTMRCGGKLKFFYGPFPPISQEVDGTWGGSWHQFEGVVSTNQLHLLLWCDLQAVFFVLVIHDGTLLKVYLSKPSDHMEEWHTSSNF